MPVCVLNCILHCLPREPEAHREECCPGTGGQRWEWMCPSERPSEDVGGMMQSVVFPHGDAFHWHAMADLGLGWFPEEGRGHIPLTDA